MIFTQQLEDWCRGLSESEADLALLGVGIDPAGLGAAKSDADFGLHPRMVRWELSAEAFHHRVTADPHDMAELVSGYVPVRLAIATDALPTAIIPRLLRVPSVQSAFIAAHRPAGALRRRTWRWPIRVGLIAFQEDPARELAEEIRAEHYILPQLVEARRTEDEPGSVDVLVVSGPLTDAITRLVRLKTIANAVLVLDSSFVSDAVLEAQLSTARAATAAVASALVPPTRLFDLVAPLTYEFSHGVPFDVALTTAAGRNILLWAEPEAMAVASVPEMALRTARHLKRAMAELEADFPPALRALPPRLETAAAGAFRSESAEATEIAQMSGAIEPELQASVEQRWTQAYVGQTGDNLLRHGPNPVFVFIGPREQAALSVEAALDESALPWEEEDAEAFRLTILLVSSGAEPPVQKAELDLPRFGRSGNVRFEIHVPEDSSQVSARIIVLFRNRILQTAVLSGQVGEFARLVEQAGFVASLTGLDDRRAFDVAFLANHSDGVQALIRHSNSHTRVSTMPGLPPITERIANRLAQAVRLRSTKKGLRGETARTLLVELAQIGRDLFSELEDQLGPVADAERIQVVTARGQWFLPIELVYARYAPDIGATICETYLADPTACRGECTPRTDRTSVCPNAFWGLSKTIERHHFDPSTDLQMEQGYLLLGLDQPRPGRRDLVVKRVLVGASSRIKAAACTELVAGFGPSGAVASSWQEWITDLKADDTELLVLLPHTDYMTTSLEITDDVLPRSNIEAEHVTGGRDVKPVVLLFGCRTTGKAVDPAGFATRFRTKGARAVFHSSTDLLNLHATELARRLIGDLTRPGRKPQLLSETLAAFRREAVHDGLIAAFAVAAYGDADWRV